jgi:hypothetical protein
MNKNNAQPLPQKQTFVARVPVGTSFGSAWSYWTGSGWSSSEAAAAPVKTTGGSVLNLGEWVTAANGHYVLLGQINEFDNAIRVATSSTPYGPFSSPSLAYTIANDGQTCGTTGGVISYGIMTHVEFPQSDGKTMVSYDQNCFGGTGTIADVSLYRPKYIGLTLP